MKAFRIYRKSFLALLLLTALTGTGAFAQQDPQSSLYMFNPLFFNPAYAGSRGAVNITGVFRYQWVGMEGSPKTGFLSVHAPFRNQSIGVGLTAVNDNIGARNNTSVFADFSFGIRLNKKEDRLAFGINGGVDYIQYNYQGLRVIDPSDANYQETFNSVAPNFGLGMYYYGERHYLGLSVPRLLESDISGGASDARLRRHYYVTAGYVFKFNTAVAFKPSLLVKLTENAPPTIDINTSFLIYNKFWIGGHYRYHESAGLNLAFHIGQSLYLGYAYDFPVNGLMLNQWGTHEVVLSLDLKTKRKAFLSPRYF